MPMKLFRSTLETPIGPMLALATDETLCALEFSNAPRALENTIPSRLAKRLDRWFAPYAIEDRRNATIDRTQEWLRDYFTGVGATLPPFPLDMRGGSFELRVWDQLREIPPGMTSTYGAIAKLLGSAGASRAVGLANGANPIAIVVPCHRVIGSNGTLTGYGGGLERKRWLLDHERQWAKSAQLRQPTFQALTSEFSLRSGSRGAPERRARDG